MVEDLTLQTNSCGLGQPTLLHESVGCSGYFATCILSSVCQACLSAWILDTHVGKTAALPCLQAEDEFRSTRAAHQSVHDTLGWLASQSCARVEYAEP